MEVIDFIKFIILSIILIGGVLFYFKRQYPSGKGLFDFSSNYDAFMWGDLNDQMICPHCQNKGFVRTKSVKRKKGVSGGKATAALFTLGVSLLATGLSRKEGLTQAHCTRCNSTWDF